MVRRMLQRVDKPKVQLGVANSIRRETKLQLEGEIYIELDIQDDKIRPFHRSLKLIFYRYD